LHTTAEMFIKYSVDYTYTPQAKMLDDWAYDHKTTVLLNGGDYDGLYAIRELMYVEANPYPWAGFSESAGALNKTLTCVGIILPERVYEAARTVFIRPVSLWGGIPQDHPEGISDFEYQLLTMMNNCHLAR